MIIGKEQLLRDQQLLNERLGWPDHMLDTGEPELYAFNDSPIDGEFEDATDHESIVPHVNEVIDRQLLENDETDRNMCVNMAGSESACSTRTLLKKRAVNEDDKSLELPSHSMPPCYQISLKEVLL